MNANKGDDHLDDLKVSYCERRAPGSQYALQVALQTMKERCHQLQLRLASSEEENLRLQVKEPSSRQMKKEMVQSETKQTILSDLPATLEELQEQLSLMNREKSQLLQHNSMVTAENHQLWEKLSRMTQVNESLGSHLNKISDTLSRHDLSNSLKMAVSDSTSEKCAILMQSQDLENTLLDLKDQSLDEISLKVINSLKQEKAELEDQCSQMVDIQNGAFFPIQNLGFNFLDKEGESTMKEVNDGWRQLTNVKEMLIQQRTTLKSLLEKRENRVTQAGCVTCPRCVSQAAHGSEDSGPSASESEAHKTVARVGSPALEGEVGQPTACTEDDRFCPLCGKFYPSLIPFEDFQSHVLDHFTPDESDAAVDNFQLLP